MARIPDPYWSLGTLWALKSFADIGGCTVLGQRGHSIVRQILDLFKQEVSGRVSLISERELLVHVNIQGTDSLHTERILISRQGLRESERVGRLSAEDKQTAIT